MPKITFISHDGSEHAVESQLGQTVMQAAINNLVPGLIADCGGSCACATCHVYIEAPWDKLIPEPSKDEREMVECALHIQTSSRLACQVIITPELDGLVVITPVSQT